MPKEIKMHDEKVEQGLDDSELIDNSDDSEEQGETDSAIKGQSNDRRRVDKNKKHRKKSKEFKQHTFEIIDNITKTMKKLENILIDYHSVLDKSEQLSERQKIRFDMLKQKRNEREDNSVQKNMN